MLQGLRDGGVGLSISRWVNRSNTEISQPLLDGFYTDIHCPKGINLADFGDALTERHKQVKVFLSCEISQHLLHILAHNLVHISMVPRQGIINKASKK